MDSSNEVMTEGPASKDHARGPQQEATHRLQLLPLHLLATQYPLDRPHQLGQLCIIQGHSHLHSVVVQAQDHSFLGWHLSLAHTIGQAETQVCEPLAQPRPLSMALSLLLVHHSEIINHSHATINAMGSSVPN